MFFLHTVILLLVYCRYIHHVSTLTVCHLSWLKLQIAHPYSTTNDYFKNMRLVLFFVVAILLLALVVNSAIHLDTTTATAVVSENRQNLNVQNADDHQTVRKKSSL